MNASTATQPVPPAPDLLLTIRRQLRTPKAWLTAVFILLYAVSGTAAGLGASTLHLLVAITGACLTEVAIVRVKRKAWMWPTSAFLSAVIIAFIIGTEEHWYVSLIISALSTVTKHVIRTRRGHVFNPAALALLVAGWGFASGESWWGALAGLPAPWILLLLVTGVVIVDRVDKWPSVLVFLGGYFGLLFVSGIFVPRTVAEMFRDPFIQAALFFAFFMLTDPPTAPGKVSEQVAIGWLVAIVSVLAQLAGAGQVYLLIGLLAGNAALFVWRQVAMFRRRKPALRPA